MSGLNSGLSSMELSIQALFKQTLFKFDQGKAITQNTKKILKTQQNISGTWRIWMRFCPQLWRRLQVFFFFFFFFFFFKQFCLKGSERYTGLACPPSEAKRNRHAVGEVSAQQPSFFTPYSSKQVKSVASVAKAAPLVQDATPVGGRKLRQKAKRSVDDMERASINIGSGSVRRSMRLRGSQPVEEVVPQNASHARERAELVQDDRRDSTVRRSARLSSHEGKKQKQSKESEAEDEEDEDEEQMDLNISLRTPPRVRERRQRIANKDGFVAPAPLVKVVSVAVPETPRLSGSVRITRSKSSLAPGDKEAEERRERAEAEEREAEKRVKQQKRELAKKKKEEEEADRLRVEEEERERERQLAKKQKQQEEEEKRRKKEEERRQKEEEKEKELQKEKRDAAKKLKQEEEEKEKQLQKDKREAAKRLKQEEEEEKEKKLQKEKREAAKKLKEEEDEKRRLKEQEEEKKRSQKEKREVARKQKEDAEEQKRKEKEEEERERERQLQRDKKEQLKKQREEEEEKKRLLKEKRELAKKEEEEREKKTKEKEAKERAEKEAKERAASQKQKKVETVVLPKSPRRPVGGKRVAQLLSKYEQASGAPVPEPAAAVAAVAAPVVAAVAVAPIAAASLPQLSLEEGALLAARLDAIASSALLAVGTEASRSRKRKTGNERAEAWSSRRGNTHSSLRDLLAAHGIVRPDAGERTMQSAVESIPESRGELGDEVEKSDQKARVVDVVRAPVIVAAPVVAATAVAAAIPSAPVVFAGFKSSFEVEDSGVSDSGVSDSEDEVVPAKTVSVAVDAVSTAVVAGSDADVKSLSTIQDRIAEIKKKFGATSTAATPSVMSAVVPPVVLAKVTPPPVIYAPAAVPNLLLSRLADSPTDFNVSLNLASAFASVASSSPVEAQSVRVMSGGDDSELGLNQSDFVPGFLTVELSQPTASPAQKQLRKGGSSEKQFTSFMDGSFFNNGVSDSEGYNTVDAERAQNAVQFLEQIQLNGNTSILHNVTLSTIAEAEEDEKDEEEEGEDDFSPAALNEPMPQSNKQDQQQVQPETVSQIQQLQEMAQFVPTSLLQQPKLQLVQQSAQQQHQSHQVGGKRSAEELLRDAKSKKPAMSVESKPSANASAAAAVADKLTQAKQRRERLEEEERRRKEDALKKANEREQRARALKAAPAEIKPTKAAILEKSKHNAQLLVKSKVVEAAGRKKAPSSVVPAPAAAVQQAPPQPVSEKKGGLFGAFKNLKPGSKKMAPSEPKENTSNKDPSAVAVAPSASSPSRSPGPRPSPLRKVGPPNSNVSPRMKSPEANVTQYSISPMKESDAEDGGSAMKQPKKREAKWARSDALMASLREQSLDVADEVFGVPIGLTCNLADVFGGYKRKNTYTQPRTSSAQWSDVPKMPFGNSAGNKK
jgi:hypothetical protein